MHVRLYFHEFPLCFVEIEGYHFPMEIKIWEARSKKGISLAELSKRTGISKSALNNYENGKRIPDMKQMEKMAIALDTTISNLYESPHK